MGKFIYEVGNRYGELVIIEEFGRDKHGNVLWLCQCDCGNTTIVRGNSLRSGKIKSCGRGQCHHNWKGGKYIDNAGYVMIHKPEHPNIQANGYVLEHISVMSDYLGRPLTPSETVHHKNGIKDDNQIENLELWTGRHPKGQRVPDLVAFAKDILREYKPKRLPNKMIQYNQWRRKNA